MAEPNTDQTQPVSAVPRTTYNLNSNGDLRVASAVDAGGQHPVGDLHPVRGCGHVRDAGGDEHVRACLDGERWGVATSTQAPMGADTSRAFANTGAVSEFLPSSTTNEQGNTSTYAPSTGPATNCPVGRDCGAGEGHLQRRRHRRDPYNPGNQISTAGYGHDGAGNLAADPSFGTLAYNGADQMTSATLANGSTPPTTYRYAGTTQDELVDQSLPTSSIDYAATAAPVGPDSR